MVIDEKVIIKGRVPNIDEVKLFLNTTEESCCNENDNSCCEPTKEEATGSCCS